MVTRRRLLEWVPAAHAAFGPRPGRCLSIAGCRGRSSSAVGHLARGVGSGGRQTWPLALPCRSALVRLSGRRPLGEPVASGRGPASAGRGRRAWFAPGRPEDVALLRGLRHAGRQHAAAGQLPGRSEAGGSPSHVADQHRPLFAVGACARDFGWIGTARGRRAARGDARDHERWRAPRPLLQLVRHATCVRSIRSTFPRSTAETLPDT